MRLGILGPLELRDEAGQPVRLSGRRLRALLIRLAIDAGRTVTAERLAEDLWADSQPADAANALQALVSRLRAVTGPHLVEFSSGGYRLALDGAEIDAGAFEGLVGQARAALNRGDAASGADLLRRALGLWRGPALADVADAPFAVAAITRLDELRLAATEDRIDADITLGNGAALVPEIGQLAAAHPLRERLRGQLMRALYAAGRQAEALAVYQETRQLLADQLGVDPSAELSAVHLSILRRDPEVTPAAPAGGPRRMTNLPAQLTSFVGREEEVERVGKLLGESRLITLTGPGGSGKTRLAVEASGRMLGRVPDGVWFVPLAPVRDAVDVPQAVLSAMGIPDAAIVADAAEAATVAVMRPLDRLADVLADKQLILVIDNCEHLVDAVARLVDRVLADAPGVRILATSREPLAITGETLCPVPSLPLPPEGAAAEDATGYAAIRLFADRAAAVRPGFTIGADTAAPVIRICRALDGIPLAIELAAARLRALTPAQVAERLDDRFQLLATGSRAALPRHQTLRAIVDWSWDLLDEAERMALRRLSVFSGGATPEAAEQVCALGDGGRGVIDVIASLVDKSLVTATGDAEVRYTLLETVRAYALERLAEAGEEDRVRAAHAGYFLGLAERAEPELRAHDQLRWLGRLAAEHDNCTAAVRYAIDARDSRLALRLVGALAPYWVMRDYDAEGGQWAAAARDIAGEPPPGLEEVYAICVFIAGIGAAAAAEQPDTRALRAALDQVASLVSPQQARHPLLALARPAAIMIGGDPDGARRALAELAEHPDPWVRAAHEAFSGHLAVNDGHPEEGAARLSAGYAGFRELGDRWGMCICLGGLAEVAMARGEPAGAARLLEEARGYTAHGLARNWGEMLLIPLGRARAAAGDAEPAGELRSPAASRRPGRRPQARRAYIRIASGNATITIPAAQARL